MKLYHEQEAIGIKPEDFSIDFADLEEMARDCLLR